MTFYHLYFSKCAFKEILIKRIGKKKVNINSEYLNILRITNNIVLITQSYKDLKEMPQQLNKTGQETG